MLIVYLLIQGWSNKWWMELAHELGSRSPNSTKSTVTKNCWPGLGRAGREQVCLVKNCQPIVVVQLLSGVQLCEPMNCCMPGLSVPQYFPEFAEVNVHWIGDAIQPSHPLLPSSPFTFSHSQHQGLFQWVDSLHQVAKILELQFQHQFFQWVLRIDFL